MKRSRMRRSTGMDRSAHSVRRRPSAAKPRSLTSEAAARAVVAPTTRRMIRVSGVALARGVVNGGAQFQLQLFMRHDDHVERWLAGGRAQVLAGLAVHGEGVASEAGHQGGGYMTTGTQTATAKTEPRVLLDPTGERALTTVPRATRPPSIPRRAAMASTIRWFA